MIKTSDFIYFCSDSEAKCLIGPTIFKYKDILSFYNDHGNSINVFHGTCFDPKERLIWAKHLLNNSVSGVDDYLNAIQFIFPTRSSSGLLMGVIAIKYDDFGKIQFNLYNKIKKKMLESLESGVYAINRIDGASRFYKNIYYSEYAKNISHEGVDLLTRYGDGNIYYKIE